MGRLFRSLTLTPGAATTLATGVATVLLVAACSPEVVIAQREKAGGTGGVPAGAGTAGSEAGGTGAVAMTSGAGGEAGEAPLVEPPRLLADSVADFRLEQGKLGWQYGYDAGSLDSFALLTRIGVIRDYVSPTMDVWDCWGNDEARWTQIFQLGAHPNGTETSAPSNAILQRAVRRWVSNFEGNVVISGEIAKIDVAVGGSNGVDAFIYVDGAQVYTTFIGGEDAGGLSYQVPAALHVSSTVDFVLDPHEGADHHDLSRFTGIITRDEVASVE